MSRLNCILIGLFLVVGLSLQGRGQTKDTTSKEKEIYDAIYVSPAIPSDQEGLQKFIENNIEQYQILQDSASDGKVFIMILIETNDSLTEFEAIQPVYKRLEEEAKRNPKVRSNWYPGVCNGLPVRASQYKIIRHE